MPLGASGAPGAAGGGPRRPQKGPGGARKALLWARLAARGRLLAAPGLVLGAPARFLVSLKPPKLPWRRGEPPGSFNRRPKRSQMVPRRPKMSFRRRRQAPEDSLHHRGGTGKRARAARERRPHAIEKQKPTFSAWGPFGHRQPPDNTLNHIRGHRRTPESSLHHRGASVCYRKAAGATVGPPPVTGKQLAPPRGQQTNAAGTDAHRCSTCFC